MFKKFLSMVIVAAALFMAPQAEAADASEVLDGAKLTPVRTGYRQLDEDVTVLLARITTPEMSTSEKVKACYDWLVDNCRYEQQYLMFTEKTIRYSEFIRADKMLRDRYGVCDDYSNAFAALVRAIGLNCRVATGTTYDGPPNRFVGHAWNVITVDGTDYIFDAQVDNELARGGENMYYRYCKTEEEIGEYYRFRGFKDVFPPIVKQ